MSSFASTFGSIREFFVLRQAESVVARYAAAQERLVRAHATAAQSRATAGRRTWQDAPAAVLLLDALRHYLLAAQAARPGASPADAEATIDYAAALPPLPPDPGRPDATPSDDERVRAALSAHDPLFLDRLPAADAARTRAALERAVALLAGAVEHRTLLNVRATRWGRFAAVAVFTVYGLVAAVGAIWGPKNVARDKPVHPSSLRAGEGRELVDGELATTPAFVTNIEDSPSVTVDLQGPYVLDEVRVHNRLDHAFDDCLPLAVETSIDGTTYKELARRDQHFAADPPWIVDAHHVTARYVRVKVLRRGYLALSELEVFGKKPRPKK